MADLNWLRIKHPRGPREAFEDMCTLVFCTHLGLPHGVNRRINQKGIESDPVAIGGRVYAYQAKFYDAATQLSGKKDDLIRAIRTARQEGVTDLMLFVDKNLPDKVSSGDGAPRVEPSWLAEINKAADGEGDEPKVALDWWTLSRIESTLDMDGYRNIRDIYLAGADGRANSTDFYEWECDQFYGDTGSELYGEVPLSECYIEPTVRLGDGEPQSVREFIESWVDDGDIAVICGEPGHGKTSLCRKAVCDFYKTGWLAGKVTNVFHFSLNPAGTDALEHTSFDFNSLLSWGDQEDRRGDKHKLDAEDCQDALVLLDGYDELLESYPIGLDDFIKKPIVRFQMKTNSRVIITTRSTVIGSEKTEYDLGGMHVPIARLQPITKAEQLGWIKQYIDCLHYSIAEGSNLASRKRLDKIQEEIRELQGYYSDYELLGEYEGLQSILGIPIVFRMVVTARYLPRDGESISHIYDELFDTIWRRYELLGISLTHEEQEEIDTAKRQLSRHALKVFSDDGDTANIDEAIRSPWVFSYYTTRKIGERYQSSSRIGFLHKSIYQHFLAREVLSWFEKLGENHDEECNYNAFNDDLSYLARRRLDRTTLSYIKELYFEISDKKGLHNAFDHAYEVLRLTDGILPLPKDNRDANRIEIVPPLVRANNVFWNIVSICSICGREVTAVNVNLHALRMYDLTGCHLLGIRLKGVAFAGINLREANLTGADLAGADLTGADLAEANLTEANLSGACLARADLMEADLCAANLRGAYLTGADLAGANLRGANLGGAELRNASLVAAQLKSAELRWAGLKGADLFLADLSGADLWGADLKGADLREADLRGADLCKARLCEADLRETELAEAELQEASLRGARFNKRSDLEKAMLGSTSLEEVVFEKND